MASRKVRFDVLAEDANTARFAERVLREFGFTRRDIRVQSFQGSGSGKQWITTNYPRFVKEFRSRNYQKNLMLIVITDADEQTIEHRAQQLDASLRNSDLKQRDNTDQVVLWIPRWHIETWYLYFNGFDVVETKRYKDQFKKHIGKEALKLKTCHGGFVGECRKFKPSPDTLQSLPSLLTAYEESQALV